jgi:hypothetical protein
MTHLEARASEQSTYVITVTCDFTPLTMRWKLTDENGNVINSRSNVAVALPGTTNTITLTGDDLAISNVRKIRRYFTVWGTYNVSDTFTAECSFDVQDLKGI